MVEHVVLTAYAGFGAQTVVRLGGSGSCPVSSALGTSPSIERFGERSDLQGDSHDLPILQLPVHLIANRNLAIELYHFQVGRVFDLSEALNCQPIALL